MPSSGKKTQCLLFLTEQVYFGKSRGIPRRKGRYFAMDEFELEEGPVSGEDLIGEIANLYPETQEFLMSLGMHCLGCAAAASETLAEACRVHGLSTFKVKRELNRIITENPA